MSILDIFIIAFTTVIFTYAVAFPIGIYSATHQYSWGDYGLTFLGFIGLATPSFLLQFTPALLAGVVFAGVAAATMGATNSFLNIGAAVVAPITPALMEFFVIAAEAAARFLYNEIVNLWLAFLYGTTTALSLPDAALHGEAFQKMLKSLPPEVTAAELVRLRTDALLQGPSK